MRLILGAGDHVDLRRSDSRVKRLVFVQQGRQICAFFTCTAPRRGRPLGDSLRSQTASMGFRPDRTVGECGRSPGHIAWVKTLWGQLEPQLKGSAYVNHLAADDRPEKVRTSFGENYARLRQVKGVYDPTNLFRLNPNVVP